ncbi:MAG TPA: M28 family peptidase [Candidatus Acidoferrum sp.]|jgi:hypothetical protein|nr:M28 family peptidase [Candidatus Acidoferrum sp.]
MKISDAVCATSVVAIFLTASRFCSAQEKPLGDVAPEVPASFKEALLTFLFILLMAIVTPSNLVPPTVAPASAPVTDFSAERAMKHLKVIAREPHPTGSTANMRTRDYIVEQLRFLGLKPEVQKSVSTTPWDIGGAPYRAATVENVIARLPGTNTTGALLLMAHYDSVRPGPGPAITTRASQHFWKLCVPSAAGRHSETM